MLPTGGQNCSPTEWDKEPAPACHAVAVLDELRSDFASYDIAKTPTASLQAREISTLPRALAAIEEIRARVAGKRVVIFLDYDGTLTPIVSDPDDAFMSESMRATVGRLAEAKKVAIVSGRSRDKVFGFVQLSSLFYAGSHGFDIAGPDGLRHRIGEAMLPVLAEARDAMIARLAAIPGASVEDNEFSISVHWRRVPEAFRGAVEQATREEAEARPGLVVTTGKCVFEIRPQLPGVPVWNKGEAVRFLLDYLLASTTGGSGQSGGVLSAESEAAGHVAGETVGEQAEVVPIYVGDDTTDEDAFRVLREFAGLSFLVAGATESERPRLTHGTHLLADTDEVQALLSALATM